MNSPKIHPVTHNAALGNNRYCGPAAISAITGHSAECAVRWILWARGYAPRERNGGVKGAALVEVNTVLTHLGFNATRIESRPYGASELTLAAWLRWRPYRGTCLVVTTTHVSVVRNQQYVCNHRPKIVNVADAHQRRARVKAVFRIEKRSGCDMLGEEPLPMASRQSGPVILKELASW